ncbi:MAG: hypothetical protein COV45_08260 [Deltaproteobacteria bacterium CG11_big_fil_rev_8_21_14_0_20_47_16]|nr:MAG: hypothetical protein COV45_08260 [Deltaproteobacteria bacterium CG11_big_fil_rev_8_21_14_0_20_47_16]
MSTHSYKLDTLADQIEAAFDYRGDVTVTFNDGTTFDGFVFNRDITNGAGSIQAYPQEKGAAAVRFDISKIKSIALTGEDTAAGKSWEDWQAKQEAKNHATS